MRWCLWYICLTDEAYSHLEAVLGEEVNEGHDIWSGVWRVSYKYPLWWKKKRNQISECAWNVTVITFTNYTPVLTGSHIFDLFSVFSAFLRAFIKKKKDLLHSSGRCAVLLLCAWTNISAPPESRFMALTWGMFPGMKIWGTLMETLPWAEVLLTNLSWQQKLFTKKNVNSGLFGL